MKKTSRSDPTVVLALGGNAILQSKQRGTYREQYDNVKATVTQIAALLNDGIRVVIAHRNGPQIGATVIRPKWERAKYLNSRSLPAALRPKDTLGT